MPRRSRLRGEFQHAPAARRHRRKHVLRAPCRPVPPSRPGDTRRLGLEGVGIQRHEGLEVHGPDTECARRVRGRPREVRPQGGVRQQPAERGRQVGLRRARQHRAREVAETLPRQEHARHVMVGLGGADGERGPVRGRDVGGREPFLQAAPHERGGCVEEVELLAGLGEEDPLVLEQEEAYVGSDSDVGSHGWAEPGPEGPCAGARLGAAPRSGAALPRGRPREGISRPLEDHGRPWREASSPPARFHTSSSTRPS